MTEMNNDLAKELADVRTSFRHMATILREGHSVWGFPVPPMGKTFSGAWEMNRWYDYRRKVNTTITPHKWHAQLQRKYTLHKAITRCMELARPADWHQLLLEWPHVSATDPSRLAYTRDERGGTDDRQVITTIGKYITRHFPSLASHHVRDITALFAADQCKLVHTTAEMLYHLSRGPQSCMKWSGQDDENLQVHPYNCYAPSLGWSMAVREGGGDTVARALVYKYTDGRQVFVRSYTKNESFSHSDTILEAWLNAQGITKCSDWDGAKLAKIERDRRYGQPVYVFPYIDGNVQTVDDCGDFLRITKNGEFLCNNTDGTADDNDTESCADCGDRGATDDGYWTGVREDHWVCDSCRSDYNYARSRNGYRYYIHESNTVYVGDEHYDTNYLGDNPIVELHDGEYCHEDNAVWIESQEAYYEIDDSDIVRTRDGEYEMQDDCVLLEDGDYCLSEEAWQCEHSDEWYPNEIDSVTTACGKTIHSDYADEYDMPDAVETTEETTVTI